LITGVAGDAPAARRVRVGKRIISYEVKTTTFFNLETGTA
jgi:hypothetical protein